MNKEITHTRDTSSLEWRSHERRDESQVCVISLFILLVGCSYIICFLIRTLVCLHLQFTKILINRAAILFFPKKYSRKKQQRIGIRVVVVSRRNIYYIPLTKPLIFNDILHILTATNVNIPSSVT